MKSANIIYNQLIRYDQRIGLIPKEDVIQEILYSICIAGEEPAVKVASRNVYRLLSDYGYSRRMGKDNFETMRLKVESTLDMDQENMLRCIESVYVDNDYTAKQTCDFFRVKYNNKVNRLLSSVFKKGGSRSGHNGIKLPFNEKAAISAVERNNLSMDTIRVWKTRGYIPGKYFI